MPVTVCGYILGADLEQMDITVKICNRVWEIHHNIYNNILQLFASINQIQNDYSLMQLIKCIP